MKKQLAILFLSFTTISCSFNYSKLELSTQNNIDKKLENISNKYQIKISYFGNKDLKTPFWFNFSDKNFLPIYNNKQLELMDKYLDKVFVSEIEKYPRDFFKKNNVTFIFTSHIEPMFFESRRDYGALGKNIFGEGFVIIEIDEKKILPTYTPPIMGVPFNSNFKVNANLLDTFLEEYFRVFHHEIFHAIDDYNSETWINLNPKDFYYTNKSNTNYDEILRSSPYKSDFERINNGFVSPYATTNPNEDKAEVFSYLMSSTTSQNLRVSLDTGNKYIENKIAYIKNFLNKKTEFNSKIFDLVELGVNGKDISKCLSEPEKIYNFKLEPSFSINRKKILNPVIGSFKNLKDFRASNNKLETLPDTFANLKELEILYLDFNIIKELPSYLSTFTKLRSLKLTGNKFRSLPKIFANLKALELLELSTLYLGTIDKDIFTLEKLRDLDLSRNNLEVIPEKIGNLLNLEQLSFANNYLETLPKKLVELKKITLLDISNNLLTTIPEELIILPKLKRVKAFNNPIEKTEKERLKKIFKEKGIELTL